MIGQGAVNSTFLELLHSGGGGAVALYCVISTETLKYFITLTG